MIAQSLVIIPTYNEALNVHSMIERLFHLYPEISVLIVDDNSPDHTARVVEDLQSKYSNLHLIKRAGKLGLGTAYLEGFNWALANKHYHYIAQMDCDFSHDPTDVIRLIRALNHADLAIGSRYSENERRTKNWPLKRLILSYTAATILRLVTGMKNRDILGGFKAFRRETLMRINLKNIVSKGYVFQFEINYKIHSSGMTITEVPITFYQRLLGVSKMNSGIILEAMKIFIYLRLKKIIGKLN